MKIVRVALALPLRRLFDYLLPEGSESPIVGARVKVPFGKGEKVGVVIELSDESAFDLAKLKPLIAVLDQQALLPESLAKLLEWASRYYHHSWGEVYAQSLPSLLRKGEPASHKPKVIWQLSEQGLTSELSEFTRAAKQGVIVQYFQQQQSRLNADDIKRLDFSASALKALVDKGVLTKSEQIPPVKAWQYRQQQDGLSLNTEQAVAVSAINNSQGFQSFLLEGITGSGKTEVYLQCIAKVLEEGKQALLLVPEIGLTPQLVSRFSERFSVPIVVLHSGLNDTERLNHWLQAKQGEAAIVIGTRSAVFTPLAKPGIIIIDEEHDSSFKQQDSGYRYHARDLAMVRAKLETLPIVLGSATPCLETLHNALSGRYQHLPLTQRAGAASVAKQTLLDMRHQPITAGLSPALIKSMRQTLSQGQQVMLFLNRRGYAPALLCHECGKVCECQRCDSYFTLHTQPRYLACHHCGSQRSIPHQCEDCGSTNLVTTGLGTEQLEEALNSLFPDYSTARIDRDSTRRKGSLEQMLADIHSKKHQILIGTQMLAKGHHFPHVTLVSLLDIDHALFSSDFRAAEHLAQLYVQVAGRAGRADLAGEVILQSHHPEHELLQDLLNNGYQHFARFALSERKDTELPPFSHQALFRFHAHDANLVDQFAQAVYQLCQPLASAGTWVFPACPAPQPRRAGKYRMQVLLQADQRAQLHLLLHQVVPQIEANPLGRKVRWSIDVDPQDML